MRVLDTLRYPLGITLWYLENCNIWQPLSLEMWDKTVIIVVGKYKHGWKDNINPTFPFVARFSSNVPHPIP
jgi:hypothetical protein